MSNDPNNPRRMQPLLPQSPQMGSFAFAPTSYQQPQGQQQQQQQPREQQKNYVFVDEHNRHKRLKVMRACEGCRRRKIKCDAATTNTWPCSACVRLKLHCVRPNGFDSTSPTDGMYETQGFDGQQQFSSYEPQSAVTAQDGFPGQMPMVGQPQQQQPPQQLSQQQVQEQTPPLMGGVPGAKSPVTTAMYASQSAYQDASGLYQQGSFSGSTPNLHYTTVAPSMPVVDNTFVNQTMFPTPPLQSASQPASPPDSYSVSSGNQYGQEDLADVLGALKMDDLGTAPYLNKKALAKSAAEDDVGVGDDDDYRSSLPPLVPGPNSKIRIPPELMPDDETVLHYFDLYFTHVHPYVPVVDKATLYQQWHTNRESISPLLLEAVFAIGGRLADDPGEGQQWLALATRHADSFLDVPRLSTLQALLIVLKAREAAPKRGYYYRSWMAIVQCVNMAKDLGLDEHYPDHAAGKSCGSAPAECLMKNRIWQCIMVCEVMIGSPQGRLDLSVDEDTVDTRIPRPMHGVEDAEYHISRNFTYFARIVGRVSQMNAAYTRLKKKAPKEWASDPQFTQLNPAVHGWLSDLPPDLAVTFPPDGSLPWLATPFIGNIQSYYYLVVILLHRPQLSLLDPTNPNGQWKQHMMICYSAAKLLCRLEEAILAQYGITGLHSMQRGVNFTIYAILNCMVLHLVALTSPDPDLNTDAREYFTRHMRILEKCMVAWPMADMQKQIDAVREAFSADTRKMFVLKPSFPYGSPPSSKPATTPTFDASFRPGMPGTSSSFEHHLDSSVSPHSHVGYTNVPITPPISTGPSDVKSEPSPGAQSLMLMAADQGQQTATWNPSRLFDQWNSTFGTPQAQHPVSVGSHSSGLSLPPSGASELPTNQDVQAVHASLPQGLHPAPPPQAYPQGPVQTFVTPAMWQESVASVYEGGLKRQNPWG